MAEKRPIKYYSHSQICSFRGCKRRWSYRYEDKLKSRAPQKPLYLGSTIHRLLEARLNSMKSDGPSTPNWHEVLLTEIKPKYDQMPQAYQEMLGEDFLEVCEKIMQEYDDIYYQDQGLMKVLGVELPIECKIPGTRDKFVGIIDAIVEINGKQYVVEHKTFKTTKMSLESTWLNQQTSLYIRRLNQIGYHIDGVIWDMIKTELPEPPRVLKDGSFGKQYSKQTIHSFIWAGVAPEQIPASTYEDIKDNYKNYFDRYITPVEPIAIEEVWNDFVETVKEIRKNKSHARTLGKECEWCEYKELCKVSLTGGDVEYTKQLLFTTDKEKEETSDVSSDNN